MVFLAPLTACLPILHPLPHVVHRVRQGLVFEWHLVKLAEILLDLVLAEVLRGAETQLVRTHWLRRAGQDHLVADEVDALPRFFESGGDRWLDALGAHVLLEVESLLVVIVEFVDVAL